LLKKVREEKPRNKCKHNVSTATVYALCEIYHPKELAEMIGCSVYLVNSIKSGKRHVKGVVDEEIIKKYGLKVCEACGLRLVPKNPVVINDVQVVLRKLCRDCYRNNTDHICYPVHSVARSAI